MTLKNVQRMRGDSCQNVDAPVKMKAFSTVGLTSDHWFEHLIHVNHACTLDVSVFFQRQVVSWRCKDQPKLLHFWSHAHTQSTTGWWYLPLWKILVSWDDYSQYMEKIYNVPNHHPNNLSRLDSMSFMKTGGAALVSQNCISLSGLPLFFFWWHHGQLRYTDWFWLIGR